MQKKEEETRIRGRESWPIKIIETAGRTLEQTLVNTDPFDGNKCNDPKCLPSKDPKNKISCRRNMVCYRVTCLLCLTAGNPGAQHDCYETSSCYYGQSGKNCHCRSKEHVSKFDSKTAKVREESAFYKHLASAHDGKEDGKSFADYFEFKISKAYMKPFTMCVEEGTFISSHKGELLNSKSEWHQARVIRTTTRVVQGGADTVRQLGGGRGGGGGQVGHQPRARAAEEGSGPVVNIFKTIRTSLTSFWSNVLGCLTFTFWAPDLPIKGMAPRWIAPVRSIHAKNVWCCGDGYFGQKNLRKKCVNRDKM